MRARHRQRRYRRRWRDWPGASSCASKHGSILLDGDEVGESLRAEDVGSLASQISAIAPVRDALRRHSWLSAACPGWSPTAATWGPMIFPDAQLKVFLTASAAMRAERRHKQLISKGISANIDDLREGLEARDAARQNARSLTAEASRRGVVAGQFGIVDRRVGRCRAESLGTTPTVCLKARRSRQPDDRRFPVRRFPSVPFPVPAR